MPPNAIHIENLEYAYNNKSMSEKSTVISIAQWQVQSGETIFLYGDSGSGKTTLLNLLNGIMLPSSGTIAIEGETISELSNSKRDAFRAQNIGVVFQQFNLIPYLTVIKNVQLAAYFAKQKNRDLKQHVAHLIESLNLPSNVLNKQVGQLSVGQQQRVAIVRALINQPKILLVDEPTSALDASARDAFMKLLMNACSENKTTLVFVSHDKSLGKYFDKEIDLGLLNTAYSCSPETEIQNASSKVAQ